MNDISRHAAPTAGFRSSALRAGDEGSRVAGARLSGPDKVEVINPHDGSAIATLSVAGADDATRALDHARTYRARLSRHRRREILLRAAQALDSRFDEAATLISLESGLSLVDTGREVRRVLAVLQTAAAELLRDDAASFAGDTTPEEARRRIVTSREPLDGAILAITPFNHPMHQVAGKVVPAVATNNRVVLKPSEKTPLSALYFADLMLDAGLPSPMLQVLVGPAPSIVGCLLRRPEIAMLSFTGSVETGRMLASRTGARRLVLELGGNDALIVMDDADVQRAALLAAEGAFANSGQRCTAVKRILVQRRLAADFTARLAELTAEWTWGDPRTTRIGTVIDESAARQVESRVAAAIDTGARLLVGHRVAGAAYAPTVLAEVDPGMRLVQEETFGPVAPVIAFDTVDEAIAIANGTAFGLSASVCTNRLDVIDRLFHALRVGALNVWEVPGWRTELAPFGGVKASGLGDKEGVLEAMRGYTTIKSLSMPWGA